MRVSICAVRCVPGVHSIIALALLAGISLLGLAVIEGAARASIPPGTNGKIVVGQIEPNYGVTIDPDGSDAHRIGPLGRTTCNSWSPNGGKVLCNLWRKDGVQPATAN